MSKALLVFGLFLLGVLLMAIAILGVFGIWERFLFISLEPLQASWQWVVGLTVGGFLCWLFGRILLQTE